MNRLTPTSLAALTSGRKQSKLIDLPRSGLRSNDGSLEMQARWITAVATGQGFLHVARITQIAFDLAKLRISVVAGKNVAVEIKVKHRNVVIRH